MVTPRSLSGFLYIAAPRADVHFAGSNLRFEGLDSRLCWPVHHTTTVHVELRSVPWALSGARDRAASPEAAALASSTVSEGHNPITAPPDYHPRAGYLRQ